MRPSVRFLAGQFLVNELISLGIEKSNICTLPTNETQAVEGLYLCAFNLTHDVPNIGLKIYDIKVKEKIFYAVDTGSIDHITAPGYHLYLIEANYEENKLKENAIRDLNEKGFSYRIRAFYNHLSIQKAYSWLKKTYHLLVPTR